MKKIIIALALIGFTCSAADAQTRHMTNNNQQCNLSVKKVKAKRVAHLYRHPLHATKFVSTSRVCREQDGYYTCCDYKNTRTRSW